MGLMVPPEPRCLKSALNPHLGDIPVVTCLDRSSAIHGPDGISRARARARAHRARARAPCHIARA